jgi:long-chain fatty acid transport protein
MVFLQQSSLRRACLVAFSISAFSLSQQAMAGGTANDNQSTMGIATAGAGQAADAADASVIFFNPAALTRFKRIEVLNVASIATSRTITHPARTMTAPPRMTGVKAATANSFHARMVTILPCSFQAFLWLCLLLKNSWWVSAHQVRTAC